MSKYRTIISVISTIFLLTTQSMAHGNPLYSPSMQVDGTQTVVTDTIEWLGFNSTKGRSRGEINTAISSGELQGWRYASEREIIKLLEDFFPYFARRHTRQLNVLYSENFERLTGVLEFSYVDTELRDKLFQDEFTTFTNIFGGSETYDDFSLIQIQFDQVYRGTGDVGGGFFGDYELVRGISLMDGFIPDNTFEDTIQAYAGFISMPGQSIEPLTRNSHALVRDIVEVNEPAEIYLISLILLMFVSARNVRK